MVDAQEAYRLGLIDRLVPHERLMEETMALAAQIADGPPLALRLSKRVLQENMSVSLEQAVRNEARAYAMAQKATNDQAEAARAFAEKRKATFTGT
jgi:enoyl-CoA hydratase/carnithine racemase